MLPDDRVLLNSSSPSSRCPCGTRMLVNSMYSPPSVADPNHLSAFAAGPSGRVRFSTGSFGARYRPTARPSASSRGSRGRRRPSQVTKYIRRRSAQITAAFRSFTHLSQVDNADELNVYIMRWASLIYVVLPIRDEYYVEYKSYRSLTNGPTWLYVLVHRIVWHDSIVGCHT